MSKDKILGRAKILVNDEFYDSEPGAVLVPGGYKNNSRVTSHSVKFNQTLIPARLTCSVPYFEGMSLRKLQEMSGAEIHFQSDTGQTHILRSAAQVGEVQVADGEQGGFVALEFHALPAEEILS